MLHLMGSGQNKHTSKPQSVSPFPKVVTDDDRPPQLFLATYIISPVNTRLSRLDGGVFTKFKVAAE
jgi:hypothetical protein